MRRVIYSAAMSLDGYIARLGGGYDWLPEDPKIDWEAFMGRFDAALMGRKTFAIAGPEGTPGGLKTWVFSRTLRKADCPNATLVSRGAARVVHDLKRTRGKSIWLLGGGSLFRSLLAEGLVDEVEVAVIPILLGEGIPLLEAGPGSAALKLISARTLPDGIVMLNYEVARGAKKKRRAPRAKPEARARRRA